MSSAVEIVAAREVAGSEVAFVGLDVAGEAARDRPDASGVERVEQRRMRHQSRHAAVAVEERVNPQQAVMRGRGRKMVSVLPSLP